MKKVTSVILLLKAFTVFLIIISHSSVLAQKSNTTKKKWPESDKASYRFELDVTFAEFDSLGDEKTKLIDCIVEKTETKYPSLTAANKDQKGLEKLSEECVATIFSLGNNKGKWPAYLKNMMRKEMEAYDYSSLGIFGDAKTQIIDCIMSKLEANYSFDEVSNDPKASEKKGEECAQELLTLGSVKGKWPDMAKNIMRQTLEADELISTLYDKNKSKFIDCVINKMEATYNSIVDINANQDEVKNIAENCKKEVVPDKSN